MDDRRLDCASLLKNTINMPIVSKGEYSICVNKPTKPTSWAIFPCDFHPDRPLAPLIKRGQNLQKLSVCKKQPVTRFSRRCRNNLKTEDRERANILNDFFSSVFTVEGNSELPDFEQKVKDEDCINQIEINAVKVLKQLKSLNVSKSCGPDNCHPFFLKECAEEIYLPLTDIFHKSLSSGVIPDDWKKANITCIFKKGNKQDPGNYRPVSLTSVICKLLERTVREEIVNHLSVNKLLSDSQFGFRKKQKYNFATFDSHE